MADVSAGIRTVKFKWNPYLEKWVMLDGFLGSNIFEFPDCLNFRFWIPDLNKDKINIVELPQGKKIAEE